MGKDGLDGKCEDSRSSVFHRFHLDLSDPVRELVWNFVDKHQLPGVHKSKHITRSACRNVCEEGNPRLYSFYTNMNFVHQVTPQTVSHATRMKADYTITYCGTKEESGYSEDCPWNVENQGCCEQY